MQKIIFTLFFLVIFLIPSWLSAQVLEEHEQIFERVAQTVEKRFSLQDQERFYTRLVSIIDTLLQKNTQTALQTKRLQDMQTLSREKLFDLRVVSDSSSITQRIKEISLRNSWLNVSWLTPYTELQKDFRYFITAERQFLQVWDAWYGMYFENLSYFPSEYGVSKSDLDRNSLSPHSTPLYRNAQWRYHFVPNYEKKILLREDVFFWLSEKFHLMQNFYDDLRYETINPEQTLREIEQVTKRITSWKNRTQKIEAIYAYLLENISYAVDFRLEDMYIYSGLEAFKRWSAVCTWYVKLMAYMLAFAGIDDFEVIKWYVIDADDFPHIGHAWLRIWDEYYDPTFDDPFWNSQTLTRDEYKYFALPRDILYTNRFEYGELPENLRTASMAERKDFIRAELVRLYPSYQTRASEFRVFDEMAFMDRHNLSYELPLTLDRLTSTLPYITVNAEDFRFTEGGMTRQIQSLNYFILTDRNLTLLLEQIHYDLSEYQLMLSLIHISEPTRPY